MNLILQHSRQFILSFSLVFEHEKLFFTVDQTSLSPPVIFIAGRPTAALLFWFFGDFRCGALLFIVIHVIYKYKNSC